MNEHGCRAALGLLAHVEPEVIQEHHVGAEFFFAAAFPGSADDVAAGDAGAVGLQDALQAEALFVGGDFAGARIRADVESAVERGGALFKNGNAAVVVCQQVFDSLQATLDRIEAFVHRVAQLVDTLALVRGGDGEGDDNGQSDLNER